MIKRLSFISIIWLLILAVVCMTRAGDKEDWYTESSENKPLIPAYFYYLELRQDFGDAQTLVCASWNDGSMPPTELAWTFEKDGMVADLKVLVNATLDEVEQKPYEIWLAYALGYVAVRIDKYPK